METNGLFSLVESMIVSSTKKPKQMIISTVKIADILGVKPEEVEEGLNQLIADGQLRNERMPTPPFHDVLFLP